MSCCQWWRRTCSSRTADILRLMVLVLVLVFLVLVLVEKFIDTFGEFILYFATNNNTCVSKLLEGATFLFIRLGGWRSRSRGSDSKLCGGSTNLHHSWSFDRSRGW